MSDFLHDERIVFFFKSFRANIIYSVEKFGLVEFRITRAGCIINSDLVLMFERFEYNHIERLTDICNMWKKTENDDFAILTVL